MKSSAAKSRSFWRNRRFWLGLAALFLCVILVHWRWQPGQIVTDGRDDLGRNALWLGHGWLGADSWFAGDKPGEKTRFRAVRNIENLARLCRENGVRDLYPHLAPTQSNGAVAACDDAQVERILDNTPGLRVLPWIGGRMNTHIAPSNSTQTARFVASVGELMRRHPRLAGVHLNVEPWKSDDAAMLQLLEQIKSAIGPRKILSVSGYPPRLGLSLFQLTWSQSYYRAVAARCDQIAPMFYDTSIHDAKLYQWTYARWTKAVLDWTRDSPTEIVFGVPTYGAAGPKLGPLYHDARVETLPNALAGLHRGLSEFGELPRSYAGAAIYCEWETDAAEWKVWRRDFEARKPNRELTR